MLIDVGGKAAGAWGSRMPATFIVDPDGRLAGAIDGRGPVTAAMLDRRFVESSGITLGQGPVSSTIAPRSSPASTLRWSGGSWVVDDDAEQSTAIGRKDVATEAAYPIEVSISP